MERLVMAIKVLLILNLWAALIAALFFLCGAVGGINPSEKIISVTVLSSLAGSCATIKIWEWGQ